MSEPTKRERLLVNAAALRAVRLGKSDVIQAYLLALDAAREVLVQARDNYEDPFAVLDALRDEVAGEGKS